MKKWSCCPVFFSISCFTTEAAMLLFRATILISQNSPRMALRGDVVAFRGAASKWQLLTCSHWKDAASTREFQSHPETHVNSQTGLYSKLPHSKTYCIDPSSSVLSTLTDYTDFLGSQTQPSSGQPETEPGDFSMQSILK